MLKKNVLLQITPPELPKIKDTGYLALAQRLEDVLAVFVYKMPERAEVLRWFTDGANTIQYKDGEWHNVKLATLIFGNSWTWRVETKLHHEPSEKLAAAYFDELGESTSWGDIFRWCDNFAGHLKENKKRQTQYNEDARMERHFNQFPPLPEGVTAFAEAKMPQYLFYTKAEKKGRQVTCSACGNSYAVPKDTPKARERATCQCCGKEATWHPLFRNGPKSETVEVWTVMRVDGKLFYRVTSVSRYFYKGDPKKRYTRQDHRRMLDTTENGKRRVSNYNLTTAPYTGYFWKRAPFGQVWEKDGLIYPDTLTDALGERVGNVDTAALKAINHEADLFTIVEALRTRRDAEYYAKAGMWRLLQVQARLSYPIEIPKNLWHLAKTHDISIYELEQLKKHGPVDDKRFEAVRKARGGTFGGIDMIAEVGIDRYIRHFGRWYAQNPKRYCTEVDRWYHDYLGMCRMQNINTDNRQVQFPQNIKQEHDRLAALIKEEEHEAANEGFGREVRRLYRDMFGYADADYVVVFPMLRTSLIAEGQSLHHCVGRESYAIDHVNGERMIFFIRKASAPEKPLYTLQANVKTGKIIQLYGYGDSAAPKKAHKFCEAFLAQLWSGAESKTKTA